MKTIRAETKMDGPAKTLEVVFLEVDMSSEGKSGCSACESARTRLDAGLEAARPVLDELGVEVRVREELVETEGQARALGFRASPTIRLGDVELLPEYRVAAGNVEADDGEDRVWSWDGEEHVLPPKAMILDAILRAYVGETPVLPHNKPAVDYEVPAQVRQFLVRGAGVAAGDDHVNAAQTGAEEYGSACGCG